MHGWEGHPGEGWQLWLKKRLQDKGFEVTAPLMPDTDKPTIELWLPFLQRIVGKTTGEDFFVAHSLGCITTLRFLESLKEDEKVGGAVLVGGFGSDLNYSGYNHELSSFFEIPINWAKIKNHSGKFVSIHSSDDPFVSLENGELFKQMLNAETFVVPNMKHFSGDDGVNELPIALESVLKISN